MSFDDEERLIEEARYGDSRAFRQLYSRYFPRLYAYASYRVGNVQDTEDLVSQTFMKVVEEIDHFEWRHDNSFAAWLFRIAHNLISNYHRHSSRAEVALPLEDLPEIAASALLPDDLVLRKETFTHLRSLVATLPERRREVITLKFFGGLKNREIARVLGIDERTVASNLCRALDDLQAQYALAGERRTRKKHERAN
jgi:RNA polymerase sigma-70 factor (ECF subfamily)